MLRIKIDFHIYIWLPDAVNIFFTSQFFCFFCFLQSIPSENNVVSDHNYKKVMRDVQNKKRILLLTFLAHKT